MAALNVRQLEAFRAIMLSGSVTGAAHMLRLTQPSVSKLIAQLEDATGARLFDRVRGRLVPRSEASTLFLQVDKAFAVLEETARSAKHLAQGARGNLRVVSTATLGLDILPKVIASFLQLRPHATIEFNIRASSYVQEWIYNHRCDIGISTSDTSLPGMDAMEIAALPAVCVLPDAHPLADARYIRPQDLAGERYVSLSPDTCLRREIDALFRRENVSRNQVAESGYASVACSLVAAGAGVSLLDPFSALTAKALGGITLKPFLPVVPFRIWALFPMHQPRSVLLDEFCNALAQAVAINRARLPAAMSPSLVEEVS